MMPFRLTPTLSLLTHSKLSYFLSFIVWIKPRLHTHTHTHNLIGESCFIHFILRSISFFFLTRVRNNNKNEEREREIRPGVCGLPSVGLGGVAMIIRSELYTTLKWIKGKQKTKRSRKRKLWNYCINKRRECLTEKEGRALCLRGGFLPILRTILSFFFWIIILMIFIFFLK